MLVYSLLSPICTSINVLINYERITTQSVDVSSGETTVTLGSNFMSGKDILFDAFLNKRMGFAFSNCGANEDTHDIIDDDADSDANDYNVNNKKKTGKKS